MLKRMAYIRSAGGNNAYVRTWLVFLGSIGFCIAEGVIFQQYFCTAFSIALTTSGWAFRKSIMEWGTEYARRSSLILFTYGVVLLAAKYMGFGHHVQLVLIGVATVLMFNLNYWTISEAVVVEHERIRNEQNAG